MEEATEYAEAAKGEEKLELPPLPPRHPLHFFPCPMPHAPYANCLIFNSLYLTFE